MPTIRVHTTQNVTLEYEIATVGDRIIAALIDYLFYFAWFILLLVLEEAVPELNYRVWLPYIFLTPTMFYFLACEVFFNGQTLGKRARSLRVARLDGAAPSLGDYLLRWLLRPIDVVMSLGVVAFLSILLSGKGQRLGDLTAGTTVISLRRRPGTDSALAAPLQLIEGYQPVFAQASVLSDHDVALIRRLLFHTTRQGNFLLLNDVAAKVKSLTGIQSDLSDTAFLETVLRDHAHLAAQA